VSQGETETEIDDAIRSARDRIEETSRMLAVQGIEARVFVRVGVPFVEIVKIADEEDVSVIWMSSHGKGWFSELLVGSTAYSVAMNASRPVIILRGQEETGAQPQFSPA
jgi:nucleotide-binding universal stress UspA family protein